MEKQERTGIITGERRRRRYRRFLTGTLFVACLSLAGLWVLDVYERIPGNIKIKMGEEHILDISLPLLGEFMGEGMEAVTVNGQKASNIPSGAVQIDFSSPVVMKADSLNSYQVSLKLFGIIPFKQVDIQVVKDKMLVPVGLPVGIYLKTEGVLVIGVGDFVSLSGTTVSPSAYLLKTGDYILKVNGETVEDKKTFIKTIENTGGEPVTLTIRRGEEEFDVKANPVQNQSGKYKLGIWVRDNAQGIGTMTYVDSEGHFGALGHGINDVDTSLVMELDSGTLYQTRIVAIRKGEKGKPGEMTGVIEYSDRNILGVVAENTAAGIFGICNEKMLGQIDGEAIPVCLKQEVETGEAQILCTVEGEPKYYDIEILELHMEHADVNKGIVLKVTDQDLIAQTGGIVQGMSGAPIIQNGKFVGAVTHVLVNDATSGYGIFIEEMLEQ